jgi:hypothetical protein
MSDQPAKRQRTDESRLKIAPSIFQTTSVDDVTSSVVDFFTRFITKDMKNVEIEAKLGIFIDRSTRERIRLPVQSETGKLG